MPANIAKRPLFFIANIYLYRIVKKAFDIRYIKSLFYDVIKELNKQVGAEVTIAPVAHNKNDYTFS
jgi:hypothetical protein